MINVFDKDGKILDDKALQEVFEKLRSGDVTIVDDASKADTVFVLEGEQEKSILQKSWDFVSSFVSGAIVIIVVLGVLAWIFG